MFEEHGYNVKEISIHRDGGRVFHLDNVDNTSRTSKELREVITPKEITLTLRPYQLFEENLGDKESKPVLLCGASIDIDKVFFKRTFSPFGIFRDIANGLYNSDENFKLYLGKIAKIRDTNLTGCLFEMNSREHPDMDKNFFSITNTWSGDVPIILNFTYNASQPIVENLIKLIKKSPKKSTFKVSFTPSENIEFVDESMVVETKNKRILNFLNPVRFSNNEEYDYEYPRLLIGDSKINIEGPIGRDTVIKRLENTNKLDLFSKSMWRLYWGVLLLTIAFVFLRELFTVNT